MNDKLEKFILQHREEFDDLVPRADIFEKIEAGINPKSISPLMIIFNNYWKMGIAASILIVAGFGLFWLINSTDTVSSINPEITKVEAAEPLPKAEDNNTTDHLNQEGFVENGTTLVENKTNHPVFKTNLKYHPKNANVNKLRYSGSASERFSIASSALEKGNLDKDIVNALFFTMQNDENINVRLAAFESLSLFAYEKSVKNQFIKSLATQKDPVIKVAIIELLTNLRTENIRGYLEEVANNKEADPMIIEKAHQGLLRLNY